MPTSPGQRNNASPVHPLAGAAMFRAFQAGVRRHSQMITGGIRRLAGRGTAHRFQRFIRRPEQVDTKPGEHLGACRRIHPNFCSALYLDHGGQNLPGTQVGVALRRSLRTRISVARLGLLQPRPGQHPHRHPRVRDTPRDTNRRRAVLGRQGHVAQLLAHRLNSDSRRPHRSAVARRSLGASTAI